MQSTPRPGGPAGSSADAATLEAAFAIATKVAWTLAARVVDAAPEGRAMVRRLVWRAEGEAGTLPAGAVRTALATHLGALAHVVEPGVGQNGAEAPQLGRAGAGEEDERQAAAMDERGR